MYTVNFSRSANDVPLAVLASPNYISEMTISSLLCFSLINKVHELRKIDQELHYLPLLSGNL